MISGITSAAFRYGSLTLIKIRSGQSLVAFFKSLAARLSFTAGLPFRQAFEERADPPPGDIVVVDDKDPLAHR